MTFTAIGYWKNGPKIRKVHWMERPWVTSCGKVVTDDWIEVAMPRSTYTNDMTCRICMDQRLPGKG